MLTLEKVLNKVLNSEMVRIVEGDTVLCEKYAINALSNLKKDGLLGMYEVDRIRLSTSIQKRQRYIHNVLPVLEDRNLTNPTHEYSFKDMELSAFIEIRVHRLADADRRDNQ